MEQVDFEHVGGKLEKCDSGSVKSPSTPSAEEIEAWAHKRYPMSARINLGSSEEKDWVARRLQQEGLSYVDKRPQGGAIWVAGRLELELLMDELASLGAPFNYSIGGGKAIGYKPGWWMKGYPEEIAADTESSKEEMTPFNRIVQAIKRFFRR